MTTNDTTEKPAVAAKPAAPAAPTPSGKQVTASKSVSFPGLNWGITQGETRDLPADPDAQATILSNAYITLVTNK